MMNNLRYKNTKISYSDVGKGIAIVLLHGFLENSTMWDSYISSFAANYRIITIDLLGHGKSECLGYVHTMEDQADMVYSVLQHLKIKKSIFVGHSMGGYIALAFAELYPENTNGFVLLNSTTYADDHERKINRNRAIKMAHKEYASLVQISIANLFSINNRENLISEINQVKTEALKTPLQGYIAAQEGMKLRKNKEHLLHLTTYPKLLILGKKDGVLNYEENIKQIEGTNVQLVFFPDGHMSHIENRDQLEEILFDFFKKY
ncbi:putative hydrolase [Flavobacterium psychrophilum]|nr:putative hydrolase [Flavobacterium psychrophilum]SNB29737.1 putative hydrolase [Flavobacterium psychrophilum]